MTKLRNDYTTLGRGLRVSIARESVAVGTGVCFRMLRADQPSLGAGREVYTTVIPSKWSELYGNYTKHRVRKIGCAPP